MGNKRLILLGVGFISLVSFILIFSLKILVIRQIVIVGNKNLTEPQIRSALGIKEGSSIFYPSSRIIYERLKKIPWIKDAIIRKDLNGTLTIHVKESYAVAILIFNEKAYMIDYEALLLEEIPFNLSENKIFLPLIKDINPFNNKEALHAAISLINFLNSRKLLSPESSVTITGNHPDNLIMYVNNLKIIVGEGDFENKFAKYATVKEEIQKRGLNVEYVDLRFPDKVIVKPLE